MPIASFWNKYQTILFDLDGTLINSAQDLVNTLNDIVIQYDMPPVPFDIAAPFAGVGSIALIECAYRYHNLTLPDKDSLNLMRDQFIKRYEHHMLNTTQQYDGAEYLLESLYASQKNIILATNKPSFLTDKLMDFMDWKKYFQVIACSDTVSKKKPSPLHLLESLEKANLKNENCLMVGDSCYDYEAALACPMDFAVVDFMHADTKKEFPKATHYISSFITP